LNTINAIGWAIFKLKLNIFLFRLWIIRILIIFRSKLDWWLIRYVRDYVDEVLKNLIGDVLMFWERHPLIILNIWSKQESGKPQVDTNPNHAWVPPSCLLPWHSVVLHSTFHYHDFIVPKGNKSIFFCYQAFLVLSRVINVRICHLIVTVLLLLFLDH
jgi:hypothetical protein